MHLAMRDEALRHRITAFRHHQTETGLALVGIAHSDGTIEQRYAPVTELRQETGCSGKTALIVDVVEWIIWPITAAPMHDEGPLLLLQKLNARIVWLRRAD